MELRKPLAAKIPGHLDKAGALDLWRKRSTDAQVELVGFAAVITMAQ